MQTSAPGTVLVSIVTYNSESYIVPCVRSVLEQSAPPCAVVVSDNASSDASASRVAAEFGSAVRLIRQPENLGFARAHNLAMGLADSEFVLTLNPDAMLTRDFVRRLVDFMHAHPNLGSATGKLLRMNAAFRPILRRNHPVMDSAGIEFLPNQRHRDRGAGQEDTQRFERPGLVFGTTAAAGFYRRAMLLDIAMDGEFFDEHFFVYREDVDLAWRAQLLGWPCGYEPRAVAYHVRQGIPERRSLLSAAINYHSVKNRFLLRIKNMPWRMYLRHFVAITWRDLLVLGYSLTRERYSLEAFPYLARHWSLYRRRRQELERRRRVPHSDIEKWISWRGRFFPLE